MIMIDNEIIRKIIYTTIAGLIILMAFSWYLNHAIKEDLRIAKQETESAQADLLRVSGVSEFQRVELARITAEADEAIKESNQRISELTRSAVVKDSLITQLRTDNQQLHNDLLNTINIPVEEPLPPAELLDMAQQLYPDNYPGAELSGNPGGLALFQNMIAEINQSRELIFNNSKLITVQSGQLVTLAAVIKEHEARYLNLELKFNNRGFLVTSLENEIQQSGVVIKAKDKQIDLLKRANFWGSWRGKTLTVAVGGGCLYLGSKL